MPIVRESLVHALSAMNIHSAMDKKIMLRACK